MYMKELPILRTDTYLCLILSSLTDTYNVHVHVHVDTYSSYLHTLEQRICMETV
jgi:hypothetical protein